MIDHVTDHVMIGHVMVKDLAPLEDLAGRDRQTDRHVTAERARVGRETTEAVTEEKMTVGSVQDIEWNTEIETEQTANEFHDF